METNNNQAVLDKAGKKSPQQASELTSGLYEWAESIVYTLAIVVIIFTFICRQVSVEGPSMENTLHGGDRLVICNLNYTPKQGDIIVLSTKAVNTPIIKRVIAVGGQTVNVDYNVGKVYVDGKEYDAPIKEPMHAINRTDLVKLPAKVPQGYVFAMGDNRNVSYDSRYTEIGMISTKNISGRAIFRMWPFSSLGFLK